MPARAAHARHAISTAMASRGLRLTGPRQALVDVLVEGAAPMSVAEVRGRLKGRRANLVSIHRTVNLLCDLGLLRVVDTAKGTQRFELAEQFTGHHHTSCVRSADAWRTSTAVCSRTTRSTPSGSACAGCATCHDLKLVGVCRQCDDAG
jgi:Fur family ferric uptake transcriptional regulator